MCGCVTLPLLLKGLILVNEHNFLLTKIIPTIGIRSITVVLMCLMPIMPGPLQPAPSIGRNPQHLMLITLNPPSNHNLELPPNPLLLLAFLIILDLGRNLIGYDLGPLGLEPLVLSDE